MTNTCHSLINDDLKAKYEPLLDNLQVKAATTIKLYRSLRHLDNTEIKAKPEECGVHVGNGIVIYISARDLRGDDVDSSELCGELSAFCKIPESKKHLVLSVLTAQFHTKIEQILDRHSLTFKKKERALAAAVPHEEEDELSGHVKASVEGLVGASSTRITDEEGLELPLESKQTSDNAQELKPSHTPAVSRKSDKAIPHLRESVSMAPQIPPQRLPQTPMSENQMPQTQRSTILEKIMPAAVEYSFHEYPALTEINQRDILHKQNLPNQSARPPLSFIAGGKPLPPSQAMPGLPAIAKGIVPLIREPPAEGRPKPTALPILTTTGHRRSKSSSSGSDTEIDAEAKRIGETGEHLVILYK